MVHCSISTAFDWISCAQLGICRYILGSSRYILVYANCFGPCCILHPGAPRLNAAHLLPCSSRQACCNNKAHQVKCRHIYSTPPTPLLPWPGSGVESAGGGGSGHGAAAAFQTPCQVKAKAPCQSPSLRHWLDVGRISLEVLVHLLR